MYQCEICGKTSNNARKISINRSKVSKRAKRRQKPNIQRRRVVVNGTATHMYVCTRCIRSGRKKQTRANVPMIK